MIISPINLHFHNMTHPTITHKQILSIALPMILANLSTPLLGMVDTAVVGHLSSPVYLGGVAIGSMIFTFLFWGFGFLRMVTTGQTSQAFGANNRSQMKLVLNQSVIFAIVIALLLVLLQGPIKSIALLILDVEQNVLTQAMYYFDIRIWSAPATLINYVFTGWLIGMGKTKTALFLALIINISNIILDMVFVNLLGMKVDGVALASVLAEYLGVSIILSLLIQQHWIKLQLDNVSSLLAGQLQNLPIYLNMMIRTLCLVFSFAFFTQQSGKLGVLILAANTVLLNFISFMAHILDGFANATEVLSGRAIGQKNPQLLSTSLKLNALWSVVTALLFSLVYAGFDKQIIQLLTDLDDVVNTAAQYSLWLIFMPIIAVWAYLLDGLFVGATMGKEMRNAMLFSVLFCYLPIAYLLQDYGNHGLWAALAVLFLSRAFTLSFYIPSIYRQLK